ncbi:MAG: hypothetical protein OCC49_08395 [Fibrobacterales bacterium]
MIIRITLKKIVIIAMLIATASAIASNFSIKIDLDLQNYMKTRSTISAITSLQQPLSSIFT